MVRSYAKFEPRVDVEGSTFSNIDYDKTDQYGNLLFRDVFPDGTVRKIGADKPTLTTDRYSRCLETQI